MKLFGPLTIVHGSTTLPKTFGGVEINIDAMDNQALDPAQRDFIVVGGNGAMNFYEWPNSINADSTTLLMDYGEMTLTSVKSKVTLYSCKIWLDTSFSIGKNEQQAIRTKFIFKPNTSGQTFKLEAV